VIFVSQCSWISLRPALGASPNPLLCSVPALTSAQIIDYLLSNFPTRRPRYPTHPNNPRLKPLYERFIHALYAACSPATNDPAQLAYIASACWPGFVTPLLNDWRAIESSQLDHNGDVTLDANDEERFPVPNTEDTLRLLHTFKPTFLPALNALLPRLTTAQAWSEANMPPSSVRLSQPLTLSLPSTISSNFASPAEQAEARLRGFTTRTRILLLASYVASFNPAKTDARLFERTSEGIAKRAKRKKRAGGAASPKKTPIKPSNSAKVGPSLTPNHDKFS
jgi:origin recognition complex subunit 5